MNNFGLKDVPLWTAIITPFFADGSIDYASFESLLRAQAACRNGVVVLGSTGEALALSLKDKKSVLEFALSLKLSLPMLVGVPGHQLEDALEWIEFARKAGVHGFLSVVPYYAKPGLQGQTEWYKKILDQAQLPVMLYNVPSRSGARLLPEVLKALSGHPSLWALKESSGDLKSLREYQSANPRIDFYCGDDGLMASFAEAGVKGLVSVAANPWPRETRRIVERCLEGKREGLEFWPACADSLFVASNPVPVKWLQERLGQITTAITRAPLDARDICQTALIESAHAQVQNWWKEETK